MNHLRPIRAWTPLLLLAFILQLSIGGTLAVAPVSADEGLARIIDEALADPALAHGFQGVLIQSLEDGRVLYERNSDRAFIPASNMKLIVSAAALDLLGPDYRMRTSLYVSGEQTPEGILKGDIILVGGGDPVLRYEHLQALAKQVKELGVRAIDGNVVGDDTRFDDLRLGWGWSWDDEPYYYSAQVSALNLNRNVVDVWVRPGRKAGDPASVRVTPPTAYMTVRIECVTTRDGAEKSIQVSRARGRNTILVSGVVPLDYKPQTAEEPVTVEEPALFACKAFSEILLREGITVRGEPVRHEKPENARLVATVESPSLSEMLAMLNKPSDNLIAECLLKTLGAEFRAEGTSRAGVEVLIEFLEKTGADTKAVGILDGSGLSRGNCITPGTLIGVLRYMHRHEHAKVFADSLPIAGVDGTLRNRMRNTAAQGNVRAKTGYLRRVSALSGYVTTKPGEPLAFSILMNNHLCLNIDARKAQEKILEALADIGKAE